MANLAAYDFGYLQAGGMMERTRLAFDTLEMLPRHRGHFYNWYDTETLQPLPPAYISTVDSGNLAGHLLTLRQGLLAIADAPILAADTFNGLADTLAVLEDVVEDTPSDDDALSLAVIEFRTVLTQAQWEPPSTATDAERMLARLVVHAEGIVAAWPAAGPGRIHPHHWPTALVEGCRSAHAELQFLLPAADAWAGDHLPTLRELQDGPAGALSTRRARERSTNSSAWRTSPVSSR